MQALSVPQLVQSASSSSQSRQPALPLTQRPHSSLAQGEEVTRVRSSTQAALAPVGVVPYW